MNFDSIPDFSLVFNPWTIADVGGGATKEIGGVSFTHSGEPMAFICFNPTATTPPIQNLHAHSGTKMGCCFSSGPPFNPNNKWLISPRLTVGPNAELDIWVQTMNSLYGYERYNVAISITDNNPSSFTNITSSPEVAPEVWTHKYYDLRDYVNKAIYIGIQCVTDNGFVFMIDDIQVSRANGIDSPPETFPVSVYPNPARDHIYIETKTGEKQPLTAELVNMTGDKVGSVQFDSETGMHRMNIRDHTPGLYSLILTQDLHRKAIKILIN